MITIHHKCRGAENCYFFSCVVVYKFVLIFTVIMANICFVCNNAVHTVTDEKTREKYGDVIGVYLSLDTELCYICSHLLNKLSIFKAICLNRISEYPAVLSQKYPMKLQKSDLEIHILCPEKCYEYKQIHSDKRYQFNHSVDSNYYNNTEYGNDNEYGNNDSEYIHNDTEYMNNDMEYINSDIQHIHSDRHVILEENVIEQFNYENYDSNNYNRNCFNDKSESAIGDKDFNDPKDQYNKSIDHSTRNDNNDIMIHSNNEHDETRNDDLVSIYDIKVGIDNENLLETSINNFNNSQNIYNDTKLNNKSSRDEDTKAVKKSKKKSDKGFKRIILNLEKQKAELEANRKEKKYLEAEFKCYNCALSFLFKDTYQAHMMRHEESNGEYQCRTCTLRFATPASLRIHAACHSERYLCRSCGVNLKPRGKKRHSCCQPREPQSVACHLCGNLLKDANGLQQHLKRVHASKASGRRYACNVCGDSYTRQGALRTHMIKHINRKFHCDRCAGTYSSPYTLNQHKKTHHNNGTMHYCDTCGASYASKKSLLAHMRNTSNHSTTTYECPICSRVCPNQKSLASHIQAVHSTTKDFTCSLCPARYTNRKSLVRHLSTHTKQKPARIVICHLCGTNFKDNSKLNRHVREVCNKAKEEHLLAIYD
ncbi:zinc finger protein 846-like isoform X2 [Maniola hyperantus]|uniref:zinc finger protein 846-like isoform X2 n=1 Tax=Aphantopus hyperantus TaxID=2795564 RepID=UPI0015698D4B|nr:putative zinc finger protein 286B [Maniola hyperantus]